MRLTEKFKVRYEEKDNEERREIRHNLFELRNTGCITEKEYAPFKSYFYTVKRAE